MSEKREVSATLFEFLIIEVVPLILRVIEDTSPNVTEDDRFYKIEKIGYKIGQNLSEILSKERARFEGQLDIIKFICKDLWPVVFKKQIDNLKTNHRVSAEELFCLSF